MADDALHEIQLNGKQLVFLFMSATVVAVVIFLCGVMVGRGVSAERAAQAAAAVETGVDPTAVPAQASTPPAAPDGASASSQENLSYPERLFADTAPPETLKEEPGAVGAPDASGASGAVRIPTAGVPAAPIASDAPAASAGAWTVQVAAIRERDEADRMAKRLTVKGYAAYVTVPGPGAPRVYRVRVGNFKDRREAESIAVRLEKEEQFKPWITR